MNTEALDLHAIKREHGGQVYDGGRRWIGPGPGHSRKDESLSVRISEHGRALVHSFAGDDFAACAGHLGLSRGTSSANLRDAVRTRQAREREDEARRQANAALAFCEMVWNEALPLQGTPGEHYLREVRRIGWLPPDVRFHSAAPRGYATEATSPAIVALARSITGAPKALQATFLAPDGSARTSRATFGAVLGAAVRLGPLQPLLAIAEGLETAASYAKLECVSTWATLGTSNLEGFQPPSLVRHLVIAADGDDAGQRAAYALAERLFTRCDVTIHTAPAGSDWNDVWAGKIHA